MTKDEKAELKRLRLIEKALDEAVRTAYQTYFPDRPNLRLPLLSFFDLVFLKGKLAGEKAAANEMVQREIRQNIEKLLLRTLAPRRKAIQQALMIPVLIRHYGRKYCAIALHGQVRQGKGATPSDAYENLKKRLASIIHEQPETLLDHRREDLLEDFNAATPLVEEEVEGFLVRVRVRETVSASN